LLSYLGAASTKVTNKYTIENPDVTQFGGPVFVQLSERIDISEIEHDHKARNDFDKDVRPLANLGKTQKNDFIETIYPDSSNLEFFYYRQPFVKYLFPTNGLTIGGTAVTLNGGWF
jgi:hypothetical protein